MLAYNPEERLKLNEIADHFWIYEMMENNEASQIKSELGKKDPVNYLTRGSKKGGSRSSNNTTASMSDFF